MFLSDIDLIKAISKGQLIVEPQCQVSGGHSGRCRGCPSLAVDPQCPISVGPTSVDLHLDAVDQAKIWDIERLRTDNKERGLAELQLNVARMNYGAMSRQYLVPPPPEKAAPKDAGVVRRDNCIVVRPGAFVLWQTQELVGTPEVNPKFICFIDGKSTRARTGLVIHLTAPTIHAGWSGKVTLEMTNCGPLHLVLHEGDAVAQLTVATITRPPRGEVGKRESATHKQTDVTGAKPKPSA